MNRKTNNIRALKIRSVFFCSVFFCLALWLGLNLLIRSGSETENTSKSFVFVRDPANALFPASPAVIPAGTQMMIPPWVLQQYHLSPQNSLYGDPLNFLIYNYGKSAPSVDNEDEDDIYVPLTRYKSENYYRGYDDYDDDDYYDRGRDDTVMMSVTHLQVAPDSAPGGAEPPGAGFAPGAEPLGGAESPPAEDEKPQGPNGPVFVTTESVDTSQVPETPALRPEENLSATYPATCDTTDDALSDTEASAPCVNCEDQQQGFLTQVGKEVNRIARGKKFPLVIRKICDKCSQVDINDLVGYMEQRSKSENVPPEIMFAIMLRESNGDCDVSGDSDTSFGLFQLNVKNSSKLRVCEANELKNQTASAQKTACKNGAYRKNSNYENVQYKSQGGPDFNQRPSIGVNVCLNNPYCNFEEALHLLKGEKWQIGNNRGERDRSKHKQKPRGKSWQEMSGEERNLWRNAIIAYNGDYYHWQAKGAMESAQVSAEHFDDWERKRIYFLRQYLNIGNRNNKTDSQNRQAQKNLIHNLAYVERITGREARGGLVGSSICQWTKFRTENAKLSCN